MLSILLSLDPFQRGNGWLPDCLQSWAVFFWVSDSSEEEDSVLAYGPHSRWRYPDHDRDLVELGGYAQHLPRFDILEERRIIQQAGIPGEVPEFGWFLYTPIQFADGSRLVAFYTESADSTRNPDYSFGCFIDRDRKATWLAQTSLSGLQADANHNPECWEQRFEDPDFLLTVRSWTRPTGLLRAWGGSAVAQNLEDNTNLPLAFDCIASLETREGPRELQGKGLAEYLSSGKGRDPFAGDA